uniref:Uncharacterized protein n=1 Tax=Rhizophora mucronata TaxID=61149 RepID=A0A2P2P3W0_RHIMU
MVKNLWETECLDLIRRKIFSKKIYSCKSTLKLQLYH